MSVGSDVRVDLIFTQVFLPLLTRVRSLVCFVPSSVI